MHPGLQRDATARHDSECRLQSLRCGGDFLLHHDAPAFVQNAVATGAISQVQANGQVGLRKFLLGFVAAVLTFFIAGLLYLLCFKARR
jgi:hypothetical protein